MNIGKSVDKLVCDMAFDSIFNPVRESLFHSLENALICDMVHDLVYVSLTDSLTALNGK